MGLLKRLSSFLTHLDYGQVAPPQGPLLILPPDQKSPLGNPSHSRGPATYAIGARL
jgi:hypothetical protein